MFKVDTKEPAERFFEEFFEGQEMPVVTKGPMSAGHQVRWAGACDNYASEFHHDDAAAKAQGLPGLLLSGPFMACYMLTEVTHWLGRRARVVSFWDRNTAPTVPRDLAHIHAKVDAHPGGRRQRHRRDRLPHRESERQDHHAGWTGGGASAPRGAIETKLG